MIAPVVSYGAVHGPVRLGPAPAHRCIRAEPVTHTVTDLTQDSTGPQQHLHLQNRAAAAPRTLPLSLSSGEDANHRALAAPGCVPYRTLEEGAGRGTARGSSNRSGHLDTTRHGAPRPLACLGATHVISQEEVGKTHDEAVYEIRKRISNLGHSLNTRNLKIYLQDVA